MTHADALVTLLAEGLAGRATPEAEEAARAHVLECADCRADVLRIARLVYDAAGQYATALDVCADIRPQLVVLADVAADRLRAEAPDVAAHLQRCGDCREELLDLQALSDEDVPGVELARPPQWRDVTTRAGERLVELVGDFVFGVGRGVVDVIASPVLPMPAPALRGVQRSQSSDRDVAELRFRIPLPGGSFDIEVLVEPSGPDDALLSVFVARGSTPVSIALLRVEAEREVLIAAQSTSATEAFVVRALTAGSYRLDVGERAAPIRYRVSICTEPKA
jgi:hypothetical protein